MLPRIVALALAALLLVSCGDRSNRDTEEDLRDRVRDALEDPEVREAAREYAREHPEEAEQARRWLEGGDMSPEPAKTHKERGDDDGLPEMPWYGYLVFGVAGLFAVACLVDLLNRVFRR